uniref:Mitochondrial carrier protein n=1 Tax=Palpitomonas bilix TaxID=652834 RepID=A0A7S3D7C3_9EUKA|mmetsp:Transcript_25278/g.63402  ORF Transcript_25278/g.63402 Transcript_25278/m.63402 type:complete len:296 (+) Transcript_25278:333-1220(+)|eukprot:CAMPEP_0113890450 /NCGR_PEP_ID=MMETSP0780_2-20120614/14149_1 /TAXON_ID=652834 /ORGANISM="Palpitomonas bilix" /LENGTH=295 /DNA_ID=CAMNT_0000879841 /DNA_START=235 /DNA_END=1122 /DNA_ORIENTATION=- /assembly_acc=CAM_ASM_000599
MGGSSLPLGLTGLLISSTASCTAEFMTVPIDVVKTRLQLSGSLHYQKGYTNVTATVRSIVKTEGLRGLFKGAAPALLRQATYGGLRLSLYEPIKGAWKIVVQSDNDRSMVTKILSGCTAGALSSFICNPTDVVKVRMMADTANKYQSRRYASTMTAFCTIWREEGLKGLYRGVGATTARAALVAGSELSVYDQAKVLLRDHGFRENRSSTHFLASMFAGLVATVVSSPADVVKSRLMNESAGARAYTGVIHCVQTSIRTEGILSLWKGFWPNYMRLGPHAVILFVTMEQLKALFQ